MRTNNLVTLGFFLAFLYFLFSANYITDEKNKLEQIKSNIIIELENEIEDLNSQVVSYENTLYGVGGATSIPENLTTADFVFPIAEDDFLRFTSPFGLRRSPFTNLQVDHMGVDIATVWRAQVVSVADGVIVEHWPPSGTVINGTRFNGHPIYGGVIKVEHDNGLVTLYAHLSDSYITEGDVVSAGQVIGRVGNTGYSTGQHLHFEMFINEENVNPMLYFSELPEFE